MKKRTFLLSVFLLLFLLPSLYPGAILDPVPGSAFAKMKMGGESMKMEIATKGIFTGAGKVIAVVPKKTQIVVGHEAIKGFMKAMPMGYPVQSAELLEKVKPGDYIHFTIDPGKNAIVGINGGNHRGAGRR